MSFLKSSVLCSMVLGGALMLGCDDRSKDTSTNNSGGTGGTMSGGSGTMSGGSGTMSGGTGNMSGGGMMSGATTRPSTGGLMDNMPTTMPSGATAAADDASAQAKEWLDKATQYIKDNKLDLASDALDKVDAMKDKLPAALQGQLGTARSLLNAAKAKGAAGGVQLPAGIPGLGGGKDGDNK